ncbi:hypothetical protein [Streptomyces sp. NPDC058279]|uniref:hypothetical protein n=1 Tax=Streptomyces sp. NPDC058279 TaxID=3346418 RepID=UPI0036E2D919
MGDPPGHALGRGGVAQPAQTGRVEVGGQDGAFAGKAQCVTAMACARFQYLAGIGR